jgi:MFS family permease
MHFASPKKARTTSQIGFFTPSIHLDRLRIWRDPHHDEQFGSFFWWGTGYTLGGVISDRIFERTGDRKKARRNLVVAGFVCSVASVLPIILLHNLTWGAVFLSLAFFFSEFTIGLMWATPMDIAPRFSGSASGLMNTGSALAAIVSPLVFGYVIDKMGDWTFPFLGSIGLLLIGAMLAFWMKLDEELPGTALTVTLAAKEAKL